MDHNDIRTLKILEKIEENDMPSQRHLANEFNVSLGLVNSFIKRLANKGYFKITNLKPNKLRYILTPAGMAEKTRLTYEFIKYSHQLYSGGRNRLQELFREMGSNGCCRIAFYGAGDFAEIAYISCRETRIDIVAIVDDHNTGQLFFDTIVRDPSILPSLEFDKILISAINRSKKILSKILSIGIPKEKILHF
jgi:predicted transcriptional regulator